VQCAVCSVQCAVCSVQCAVCSVRCAVCSVQCAVCACITWAPPGGTLIGGTCVVILHWGYVRVGMRATGSGTSEAGAGNSQRHLVRVTSSELPQYPSIFWVCSTRNGGGERLHLCLSVVLACAVVWCGVVWCGVVWWGGVGWCGVVSPPPLPPAHPYRQLTPPSYHWHETPAYVRLHPSLHAVSHILVAHGNVLPRYPGTPQAKRTWARGWRASGAASGSGSTARATTTSGSGWMVFPVVRCGGISACKDCKLFCHCGSCVPLISVHCMVDSIVQESVAHTGSPCRIMRNSVWASLPLPPH
jgi:hypothetical protein